MNKTKKYINFKKQYKKTRLQKIFKKIMKKKYIF